MNIKAPLNHVPKNICSIIMVGFMNVFLSLSLWRVAETSGAAAQKYGNALLAYANPVLCFLPCGNKKRLLPFQTEWQRAHGVSQQAE